MNQAPFVQIPCVKCGSTVWIAPAAGMGYCPSCQTPNQLPPGAAAGAPQMGGAPGGYGAAGAPPMGGAPGGYGAPPGMGGAPPGMGGYGAPPGMGGAPGGPPMGGAPTGMGAPGAPPGMGGAPGMPPVGPGAPSPMGGFGGMPGQPGMTFNRGGGSGGMIKAVGGGVGTVVLLIAFAFFKFGLKSAVKSSNQESLSSLGIEKTKADPDKMIAAARAYAKKWKSDAGFWSVNILKLGAGGTVDLTSSNVVVEYFSPSAVSSPMSKIRDNSIKKFNFNDNGMNFNEIWGVRKQYSPAPRPTAIPGCTAKQLAAKLGSMGILKSGGTVHVQIDPAFGDEWLVQTPSGPKRFDLATCGEKKR